MAVFTAIATSIVSALAGSAFVAATATTAATLFGSVLVASIATGVIATGLAVGTAKLLGLYKTPSIPGQDQGVKVQLAPSTDNKVARLYGRNYTGAILVDAEIKNQNKTMILGLLTQSIAVTNN
jgi:hypothetical protein